MQLQVIIVIILGFISGYLVKTFIVGRYKGPSSRSVQKTEYSKTHRFEPEIYVCPPSIDPDQFSHSSTEEDE